MVQNDDNNQLLVSYLTLRIAVGAIGIALPFVLMIWGFALAHGLVLQPTISDYYSLRTRDALVGALFAIGTFLFTYRGYDRKDDIAGKLACLFAIVVAVVPISGATWEKVVHSIAATALFLLLAYFCLFLFRKSAGLPTRQKQIRNRVYLLCGLCMLGCIALIGLYMLLDLQKTALGELKPIFWLESIALWAFGFSWFVKGEAIWKDAGL